MKFVEKTFLICESFFYSFMTEAALVVDADHNVRKISKYHSSFSFPLFFRSCLEVPAPAFLKQSFITFQINISLYFSHFAVCFCPFLLLFQLQGIWSSLSRRFTPRHAPTRLPCATNSFSALKLKITTSFLSFSPPSYLCR